MIEVCEIFASLAGEGAWTGRPAAFVRLAGCNLRCRWCDARHAWSPGERMRRSGVLSKVRGLRVSRVVVTGGEPLLQQETPALLKDLLDGEYRVGLETNGSLPLDQVPKGVHIVMDLKPPSSGHADANRWENLDRLGPHDEIKVVAADRTDFDWMTAALAMYGGSLRPQVVVQPAYGRLSARRLAEWVLDERMPVRLGIQLHKHLWGGRTRR